MQIILSGPYMSMLFSCTYTNFARQYRIYLSLAGVNVFGTSSRSNTTTEISFYDNNFTLFDKKIFLKRKTVVIV